MINATADAATDHEVVGSTAFPNFTNGAVDNYYSMAYSHIDNSPFAEGTSSPADTGPVGQTAAAGNFSQPQYADARWPGSNSGQATFGNAGGPYAVANASSFKATAQCEEASSDNTGSSGSGSATKIVAPAGFAKNLKLALAAWKARWLVPLGLKKIKGSPISLTLPVTTPSVGTPTITTPKVTAPKVTTPSVSVPGKKKSSSTTTSTTPSSSGGGGGGALLSTTSAKIDPKSGAIVTSGQSSLGSVNLGGGQIVIDGINVSVSVTNTGKKPTAKISVNVADASIGGVPVTIDQNGVQVQGQGQALPYQQADDALNSALKQAGVEIFTVQPEVKKSKGELTVTASGVHVLFTQPVDQSGVPAQNIEHIFGDVFVDSLAAKAGAVPKLNLSGSSTGSGTNGGSTGGGGLGTTGGSGSSSGYGSTGSGAPVGSSQAAPTSFTSLLTKPSWLLIAYLIWQAMVIGTGASLWRWRMGAT